MTTNQLHGLPASSSASSAALRGASLAFQNGNKSRGLAAPSTDSHDRALAAATISAQTTGGSTNGLPDIDQQQARTIINSRLQQQTQYLSPKNGGKDASFIAATLAASRSASPSPRVRRSPSVNTIRSHTGSPSHLGSPTAAEHVDAASIPPTGNLIRMFEGGSPRRRRHGGSVDEGIIARRRSTPSPKRVQRLPRDPSQESLGEEEEEGDHKHEKTPDIPPQQSTRPKTPHPKPVIMQQKPTPERIATSKKQDKLSPASRAHTPTPTESQPRSTKHHTARDEVEKPRPNTKPVDAQKRPSNPPKPVAADPKPPRSAAAKPPPESTSYNMAELRSPVLGQSTPEIQSPAPRRLNKLPLPPPPPPTPPQHSRTISRPSPQLLSPGDPEKRDSPRAKKSQPQPPTPPKPRESTRVVKRAGSLKNGLGRIQTSELDLARTSETDSPQDVFVSAPTSPTYSSPPPQRMPQRLPSPTERDVGRNTPSPTRWSQRPSQQPSRNNLDFDSLTSAIMAGSLASSRLTPSNTGSTMPPILPQRTRSPRLRTTMRNAAAQSSDSEDDRHKKSRRPKLRSGKHAHHEGARKKWRDQIRPRERKRYEAVWASNRGYHLPTTSSGASSIRSGTTRDGTAAAAESPVDYAEYIANVVVRDIWRRSRLPEDELVEVWELVDRKKRGMLDRSEFVVGMWLIDQRLRGRKIPQKVSDSVWASAHGMLRVKTPKRH
ncbi:increased rdna silencing irs4 [Emericellopsis cladophorae]|uniref:Increased rdna silencing irs4 n=1 Tax=Emericellopsis cladophorae TaxID=2686198 RepID=A0A9Q0BBK4_9HYPO|nr:increased rdna silencing irs4 [Emericellopsis cladophorae]KAI6779407.1 increased rdna silencing irs4 [Emericellopsis cladophorae]